MFSGDNDDDDDVAMDDKPQNGSDLNNNFDNDPFFDDDDFDDDGFESFDIPNEFINNSILLKLLDPNEMVNAPDSAE